MIKPSVISIKKGANRHLVAYTTAFKVKLS